MLLELGKAEVKAVRKREHGLLRARAQDQVVRAQKLREALEHESVPERRIELERAAGREVRRPAFHPFTAGIRFPNQQHDLPEELRRKEPLLSVIVRSRLERKELERLGFRVRSQVGELFTAWVSWSRLDKGKLDKVDGITSVELARASSQHLDNAMNYTGLAAVHAEGETGSGVIIGVADRYIDFHHPAFTQANQNGGVATRILSIWDQTQDHPIAGELSPAALSKTQMSPQAAKLAGLVEGVEYDRGQIDQTLGNGNNPFSPVRHEPPLTLTSADRHGTQVAGAALGHDPLGTPARSGAAPGAELIFVHVRDEMPLDAWKNTDVAGRAQETPPTLGMVDSAALIDACTYIFARAEEQAKPCVACLCYGDSLGPHDGTSTFERSLEGFVNEDPARVIVVSAGNEQGMGSHAAGQVQPPAVGGTAPIGVVIGPNSGQAEEVQIWFDGADLVEAALEYLPPAGGVPTVIIALTQANEEISFAVAGTAQAIVQTRCPDDNGSSSVTVLLLPDPGTQLLAEGTYTIRLRATTFVSGSFQAWMSRCNDGSGFQVPDPSQQSITTPATAFKVIAVGAHGMYDTRGQLAPPPLIHPLSGIGPARDNGRQKPDLCAPSGVMAPVAADRLVHGVAPLPAYGYFVGTSAAAPIVAGAAAIMIERRLKAGRALDWPNVLNDLLAETNQAVGTAFDARVWGAGWLSV
jgi:subtilisin family serine protease